MFRKVLYQTVGDRGNPKEILNNGPFQCTRSPWLGNGYYFWDSFIELAHWWGRQGYHGQYVITRIDFEYNPDDVLDLVGNTEHLIMFREYAEMLSKDPQFGEPTVGQVIEHMKRHTSFPYKAIRVEGRRSISYFYEEGLKKQLLFKLSGKAFLDLLPPIQICFFDKEYVLNSSYSIVYPDWYRSDYSI